MVRPLSGKPMLINHYQYIVSDGGCHNTSQDWHLLATASYDYTTGLILENVLTNLILKAQTTSE